MSDHTQQQNEQQKYSDNAVIKIDRSRVSDAERCLRLRYWRYEHDGIGLEQAGEWLDPLIGTAVHTAIEHLLMFSGKAIEDAVALGRETLLSAQRQGPILVYKQSIDPAMDFAEGQLLMEALVRGFASMRLPAILTTYEVVAIEREMSVDYSCAGRTIRQLSRPDIVLRRRADSALFIMNLKTASRVDDKWRTKWRYDMQTFSEATAVEAELGEPVAGTIIVGLVKGSRKDYERDLSATVGPGKFHWSDTPLLWAWKRDGGGPGVDDEWYARYEWQCTGPHTMGNGRKCSGGATHKLSGVRKACVSDRLGGVSGWISYLAVSDRQLLEEQFVELPPILRSAYEIERWKRQALPCEVEIRERRDQINSMDADDAAREDLFDRWFPMSTADGNCIWPTRCQFFEVCHGTARDDLAGAGFVPRNPNHANEVSE